MRFMSDNQQAIDLLKIKCSGRKRAGAVGLRMRER
jgi:hypothetical protein